MNIIIYFLVQQHFHGLYGISACPNSFEISKDSVFGEFGDRTTGFLCNYVDDPEKRAWTGNVLFQNIYCQDCWASANQSFDADYIYQQLKNQTRQCLPQLGK